MERSNAICVPCVAGSATHVSLCTVSGVLITSCRERYARQATREKRVRETIHYAACVPCVHRQSGVWHEAGFVDFGLASCSREFPRLRARNAPTWPSEAQCTKPGVMGSL